MAQDVVYLPPISQQRRLDSPNFRGIKHAYRGPQQQILLFPFKKSWFRRREPEPRRPSCGALNPRGLISGLENELNWYGGILELLQTVDPFHLCIFSLLIEHSMPSCLSYTCHTFAFVGEVKDKSHEFLLGLPFGCMARYIVYLQLLSQVLYQGSGSKVVQLGL